MERSEVPSDYLASLRLSLELLSAKCERRLRWIEQHQFPLPEERDE